MLPTGEWRHPVGMSGKLSDTPHVSAQPVLTRLAKVQHYRTGVLETRKCFCQVQQRHKALPVRNTLLYISLIHEIQINREWLLFPSARGNQAYL